MERIRRFMINYPLLSIGMLVPVCLIVTIAIMSILIKYVFPIILAFWLSNIIYSAIVGKNTIQYYSKPFWFIRH